MRPDPSRPDPSASSPPAGWPWWHSLKVRIAAGALAAVFAGVALTSWHMGRLAEEHLLAHEAQRSHEEVQRMAAVVGHRVAELQRALRLSGGQLQRPLLGDRQHLAAFFTQQPLLRSLFSDVGMATADGHIRVLVDATGPKFPTVSIADRDYFQRALSTRQPVVSQPLRSRISNAPMVALAHPLIDGSGFWGVLVGTVSLESRDLLLNLAEGHDSDEGMLIAVSDGQGRILAHPQRARLLQDLASEPRLAETAQQWIEDGRPLQRNAGRWTNATDVVAMAGEPLTGWHVWRTTSRAALLAPLHAARGDAVVIAVAFALMASAMLMVHVVGELQPLSRLRERAAALLRGDDRGEWPESHGEVGALAKALRALWDERTRAERLNAQALQKLSSVMAASPVGLAFSRHQRFELASAECCSLLGYQEHALVGQPVAMIFAAPAECDEMRSQARAGFAGGRAYEGEWRLRTAAGRDFWARIHARPVLATDPDSGSIWSFYDIDAQVAARETLTHAASHDPLTGLLNRKGLEQHLESALAQRPMGHAASLVMLDLDHFKPINDRGGHAAGDAMLVTVAGSLTRHLRGTDAVARLGGDEFVLVLPGCDQAGAEDVAAKALQGIRETRLAWGTTSFRVEASVGVAELTLEHLNAAEWLAAADAACYEAKAAGRNTVRAAVRGNVIALVAAAS